ncbi:hypothetical protein GCM10027055_06610 [Janibacter alkaliphilus]
MDLALQPEQRRCGGQRDPVLAGAGLGDELALAHPLRQQALAEAVVDLVAAGVVEVLALEVDLRAAEVLGETAGEEERGGATTYSRSSSRYSAMKVGSVRASS